MEKKVYQNIFTVLNRGGPEFFRILVRTRAINIIFGFKYALFKLIWWGFSGRDIGYIAFIFAFHYAW